MSSLNVGYVKVLHGFKAMQNGFDRGCKFSSHQVYGNIKTRAGESFSLLIGIKDCSKRKCRIGICQIHIF